MVDFKKLIKNGSVQRPIDPIEIFRRLPRPAQISDLWSSQAEALRTWHERRNERDIIIKLNTGGGKTLVGLLIAQSIMNETGGSALYLCPTRQLMQQTFEASKEYGFKTSTYKPGNDLDDDFLSGKSILIATYYALFNGWSKFGTTERGANYERLAGIVLDDAHTALSIIRDQFTLEIQKSKEENLYFESCGLFKNDFKDIQKITAFEEIINGRDPSILEVPYWSWHDKSSALKDLIKEKVRNEFPWPLLRDEFDYCHALIDSRRFAITPILPLVDKFPSFSDCPRRVYMSATLADDSSIVRTFDANVKSVIKAIVPKSLSGIGERMILIPASSHMSEDSKTILTKIINNVKKNAGVLILVPKNSAIAKWNDVAAIPKSDDNINININNLRQEKKGAYVFAGRYDGLDLPNDSCRLLIMDGKPIGQNIYDSYRIFALGRSELVNASTAQRIEQGLGRGTRGAGDYCVVLLLGNDLISWIGRKSNINQLTPSTRIQLEIGIGISEKVTSSKDFEDTINQCLKRDEDWIQYHAESLSRSENPPKLDINNLNIAAAERRYFDLIRKNQYDKAVICFEDYLWGTGNDIDKYYQAWLFQLNARAYYYWGNKNKSRELQLRAYSRNTSLLKPAIDIEYSPLVPGNQARSIIENIGEYRIRSAYIAYFEDVISSLTPSHSSNQFEESLKNLGSILGFNSSRPEKEHQQGPDILWMLNDKNALLMEAKSKKKIENPLTKDEAGQSLTNQAWFKKHYPTAKNGFSVVVHPNNYCTGSFIPEGLYAFTLHKLNILILNVRKLITELCNSGASEEGLLQMCEKKLDEYNLADNLIIDAYLDNFELSI